MILSPNSTLTVCGIGELGEHGTRGVTHVLSILDPGWPEPEAFQSYDPHHRTTLHFHDEIEERAGIELPQIGHVESILAFGRALATEADREKAAHLLIHCHAGISRSTAAMTMLLAQAHPHDSERDLVERLVVMRPQAWPNSRMIGFADDLLARRGLLKAEVSRLYKRRLDARPELAEVMKRLNRQREVDMALQS